MDKGIEIKIEKYCIFQNSHTGEPKRECLLKESALCNCKNYERCETYLDYKNQKSIN